jgi:hypothetical protein
MTAGRQQKKPQNVGVASQFNHNVLSFNALARQEI